MISKDFQITNAYIKRKRFEGQESEESGFFDIRNIIVEINFYESLYLPYIAGQVVLSDSNSLSSLINFQGQEILELEWSILETTHKKEFVIYAQTDVVKSTNDYSSTYVLQFIEKHAFLSYFKRLRGSKSGNFSNIISQIIENELGSEVGEFEESFQSGKILECNRTPLGVCQWLTQRCTSESGEPMFLYSTLKEGIQFKSLGSLLQNQPLNQYKFRYTALPYKNSRDSFIHERTKILSLSVPNNNDSIAAAKEGVFKSRYFSIDPFTRSIKYTDFDAKEHFEDKVRNEATLYSNPSFDTFFNLDNDPISKISSEYFSEINTSYSFGLDKSYSEEREIENHKFKVSRHSDLFMMDKERLDIVVLGYFFGEGYNDRTIGTVINIFVPKDQPGYSSGGDVVDKKRSGKFLITHARHTLSIVNNEYRVALSLARVGTPDNINDRTREENEETPS